MRRGASLEPGSAGSGVGRRPPAYLLPASASYQPADSRRFFQCFGHTSRKALKFWLPLPSVPPRAVTAGEPLPLPRPGEVSVH